MNYFIDLSWAIRQILSKQRTPLTVLEASRFGLILSCSMVALEVQATPPAVNELPSGGQITAGSGTISQTASKLTVMQNSNRLITDWNTFNIGSKATVNFKQPSQSSVALNRVASQGASQIFGQLNANGQVFLINPSGIVFAPGAQLNVGGMVASTLNMSNEDFLNGRIVFENTGNAGDILNQSEIAAFSGGYVALIAPRIYNEGTIAAPEGTVALASGNKVTMDFASDKLVNLTVDQGTIDALIENKLLIMAQNGVVIMSAKALDTVTRSVVNNTGVIEATGVTNKGGRILLTAEGGDINISGALDVSSSNRQGGDIIATADNIVLKPSSELLATGATGGGEVLVGGDWQGSGNMQQATTVTMEQGASIDASSTENGDGGKIVLWSDTSKQNSKTIVAGSLRAKAGEQAGNGGQIETSGHEVEIEGITVDSGSKNGNSGEWLIDPYNWVIGATNAGHIASALDTGTNVTIDTKSTASSGSSASNGNDGNTDTSSGAIGDITVSSAISKTSGGNAALTMKAANSIIVDAAISSTAGELDVTLDADNNSGTGDGGGIVVLSSNITTNGGDLRFGTDRTANIGGVSTKIGGDVYVNNASTLSTNGGNVEVSGEMIIANATGLTVNSAGGDVTFDGVLNSGNIYAFVSGAAGAGSWELARDSAKNGTAGGSAVGNSYMVSITSRLENSIASSVTLDNGAYRGAWIGAFRDKDASAPNDMNWKWTGGSEADQTFYVQGGASTGQYSNFASGEPNGSGSGGEYAGQFFGNQALWNDLGGGTTYSASMTSVYSVMGYVRETNIANSPLTINAGNGAVSFGAAVGNSKALSNLTVNSASAISVSNSVDLSGNLALTLDPSANSSITQAASWKVGGTSSFTLGSNDLTLNHSGNDFVGSVSMASANDVSIRDVNTLSLSGISTTGSISLYSQDLSVNNNLASSGGGDINITSNTVSLGSSTILQSTGNLDIHSLSSGVTIGLAGGTGSLNLTSAELGYIQDGFSSITLGSTNSGAMGIGAYTFNDDVTLKTGGTFTMSGAIGTSNDDISIYTGGRADISENINASGGNIIVDATAGVSDIRALTITASSISTSGAGSITLTGDATSSTGDNNGYGIQFNSNGSVVETGSGNISLIGTGTVSAAAGNSRGVVIEVSDVEIRSASGTITVKDINPNKSGGYNGLHIENSSVKIGKGALASSSSDVIIEADKLGLPATIDTTGTLTIRSNTNSFLSALDTGGLNIGSGVTGLTLGKTSNTAGVTIGQTHSIAGDINIYAGNIAVNNALTATNSGGIKLQSSGVATQSAAITASGLELLGTGDFALNNTSNNVAVLAANAGNISYIDSNALTIGTVNTTGITSSGTVNVSTQSANLTVSENITATDTSASAIILNAGKATNAGTSTGGNIVLSGTPIFSTGTGGRATLYSGSIADSTGLSSLIGAGSGRFRYNSDESATNYTSALGAGKYAVYREQPTLTITAEDKAVTYGTGSTLTTAVSGQNGDTVGQALSTAATVSAGGSTSTSGNQTVGSHTLTAATAVDQLGYAVSYTAGSLTVNKKDLTASYLAVDKVYDGNANASVTGSSGNVVSGDTVTFSEIASFATKGAGSGKTVNISSIAIAGSDAGNYNLTSATAVASANIMAKSVTVSGITGSNKTYDGSSTATLDVSGAIFTGLVSNDNLELSSISGLFADKNVGSGKAITLASSSYTGSDAGNYQIIDQESTVADITEKPLVINLSGLGSKEYDGTGDIDLNGVTATLSGIVSGDDIVVVGGNVSGFADKNVGDNKVVVYSGFEISGNDATNYELSSDSAASTASITAKAISVSGITVNNKVYDGTAEGVINEAGVLFAGMVPGDNLFLSARSGLFADKNAGTDKMVTLASTYGGSDVGNYLITDQASTSANIDQAELSVTANNETKVIDGIPYAGGNGVIYSGFVNGENSDDLGGTLSYGGSSQGASDVGDYSIAPSGQTSDNYIIAFNDSVLNINAAGATVDPGKQLDSGFAVKSVAEGAGRYSGAAGGHSDVVFEQNNNVVISTGSDIAGSLESQASVSFDDGGSFAVVESAGGGIQLIDVRQGKGADSFAEPTFASVVVFRPGSAPLVESNFSIEVGKESIRLNPVTNANKIVSDFGQEISRLSFKVKSSQGGVEHFTIKISESGIQIKPIKDSGKVTIERQRQEVIGVALMSIKKQLNIAPSKIKTIFIDLL